jgi:hypothetical protein
MTLKPASNLPEPFLLHLRCLATQDGLTAQFYYDRARFAADAVDCIAGQWVTLLADALRAPNLPIERLGIAGR